ncbi:UPF0692 protein C19orf54 homolog [Diaphorina citri]|uniref:Actin maturation protease n=1 Tax=Diaphorina citri TaxID=121845 RepID=A0A1S3DGR4_DIACI|nr:UPF0692 protein C19orf54 homolog [Diaphorina citri]
MFSVANLKSLCNQVLGSNQLIIHHGTQGLEKDRKFIADHLKTGAVALIPYDADYNHDPCLKHGLKAHWALIFGLLEPEDEDEVYLLARQGKSNHIGVWRYSDLSASNANLRKIDPKRNIEDYFSISCVHTRRHWRQPCPHVLLLCGHDAAVSCESV